MRPSDSRVAVSAILVALAVSLSPRNAIAAPASDLPARAHSAESVKVEFGRIARALTSRRGVKIRRVLTVDFDRDGDLDVLAATDQGILLWLNDGLGHLTAQHPNRAPGVAGGGPANTWRERRDDTAESIQNDPPSLRYTISSANAPPVMVSAIGRPPADDLLRERAAGRFASRAPPIATSAFIS